MNIRKAVIPAAGLGTRLLPATKAQPKEMLPIVDKPTIQFIVEEAVASGIQDIVIITGRTKKAIEDHFDRSVELEEELEKKHQNDLLSHVRKINHLANIYYIRQQEALGLGHAVACARTFIGNEPFAVLLGDDIVQNKVPALAQLISVYDHTARTVLGVQQVDPSQVDKYGIVRPSAVLGNNVFAVSELVEKPSVNTAPSNIAILGRYILTPGIFDALEATPPGKNGEIQLTDAINLLAKSEEIYACAFDGKRYDVGDRLGYLRATVELGMQHELIGQVFTEYLATLSLDDAYPLRATIGEQLRKRREIQETVSSNKTAPVDDGTTQTTSTILPASLEKNPSFIVATMGGIQKEHGMSQSNSVGPTKEVNSGVASNYTILSAAEQNSLESITWDSPTISSAKLPFDKSQATLDRTNAAPTSPDCQQPSSPSESAKNSPTASTANAPGTVPNNPKESDYHSPFPYDDSMQPPMRGDRFADDSMNRSDDLLIEKNSGFPQLWDDSNQIKE